MECIHNVTKVNQLKNSCLCPLIVDEVRFKQKNVEKIEKA